MLKEATEAEETSKAIEVEVMLRAVTEAEEIQKEAIEAEEEIPKADIEAEVVEMENSEVHIVVVQMVTIVSEDK